MVPSVLLMKSVLCISPDQKSFGSCLVYPVGGVFYFITAKHVVETMKPGVESEIYVLKDQLVKHNVVPYFCEDGVDVAVMQTFLPVPVNDGCNSLVLSSDMAIIGQDMYFCGFPFLELGEIKDKGKITYKCEAIHDGFPIPFVKKAFLSRIQSPVFFLDGHNNIGFSGGPVVFWDTREKKHKVLGIMSSYLNHYGGIKLMGASTQLFYAENSGIAVAYDIRYAVELIEKISLTTKQMQPCN